MKKLLFTFLLLSLGFSLPAQVRTYSDNASGTFVVGLDSYYYGPSGSLDFKAGGHQVHAKLEGGTVTVDGSVLSESDADTVIGIHDFTGDREPELVVARRSAQGVRAAVYTLDGDKWKQIGQMIAFDAPEIRVFRQVVSIRRGDALYSWTWHEGKFDFKASDGSKEPTAR